MFNCIIYGNDGTPYCYGPFVSVQEANAFGVSKYGYRFVVAQFVDIRPDEYDRQRDEYLASFGESAL